MSEQNCNEIALQIAEQVYISETIKRLNLMTLIIFSFAMLYYLYNAKYALAFFSFVSVALTSWTLTSMEQPIFTKSNKASNIYSLIIVCIVFIGSTISKGKDWFPTPKWTKTPTMAVALYILGIMYIISLSANTLDQKTIKSVFIVDQEVNQEIIIDKANTLTKRMGIVLISFSLIVIIFNTISLITEILGHEKSMISKLYAPGVKNANWVLNIVSIIFMSFFVFFSTKILNADNQVNNQDKLSRAVMGYSTIMIVLMLIILIIVLYEFKVTVELFNYRSEVGAFAGKGRFATFRRNIFLFLLIAVPTVMVGVNINLLIKHQQVIKSL